MGMLLLVLAAVMFAALWSVGESSREEAALLQVSEICAKLRSADEHSLAAEAKAPPRDPWGRPFSIRVGQEDIVVRTAGPDGRFDSEDDIGAALDRRTGRRVFLER